MGKKELVFAKILVHYNSDLRTSKWQQLLWYVYGISAVISHVHPDGTERLIAFASWTLTKNKGNYAKVKRRHLLLFGGKSTN